MKPIRILAIAPYQGMRELMTTVAERRSEIMLTAFVGDLDTGLAQAHRAMERDSYDIILSRGGTAELLSRSLDIPTLDISTSLGDILQAIKLAGNLRAPFAIVGFASISDRARLICELLGYDISVYTIEKENELPELLPRLRAGGCQLIVGDAVTTGQAQNMGFNTLLITSSAETIESALDQAVKLCRSYVRANAQYDMFRGIAEQSPAKVAVFDPEGKCKYTTLGSDPDSVQILNFAQSAIPTLNASQTAFVERTFGGKLISVSAARLEARGEPSTVVYIREKNLLPAVQCGAVSIINRRDAVCGQINHYYGASGATAKLRKHIDQYNQQDAPILLEGEPGTGKDSVAFYLYTEGPFSDRPLYAIDCSILSDKQFDSLLANAASPLNEKHTTVYFNKITRLSEQQLERLFLYVEQSRLSMRCRLICSLETDAGVTDGASAADFIASRLRGVILHLPPLRERREDIPDMVVLYINQYNAELGKQLVGVEPEAMAMLCAYAWPNNLDQFRRVLHELATISTTFNITAQNTSDALRAEDASRMPCSAGQLDLNRPLDDIMYDVLRIVLAEENNNQKRTAERLCISRSTLWRMLKTHEQNE